MNQLFMYHKPYLVHNSIQTRDGTILVSKHRHDYVSHKDTIDGTVYSIDGGLEYQRGKGLYLKDLSIVTDDHFVAREYLEWGTYGKNGDEPLHYKKVKDLDTGHIHAILSTQTGILECMKVCLTYELLYRAFNDSGWKSDLHYDEEVEYDE